MWAGLLAQLVLLLLLLLNSAVSDTDQLSGTMGAYTIYRDITMGPLTWTVDMEHEQICG